MPELPPAVAYVCTPSSLMESTPCLKCLSEHEMLAVIVGIIALATDKTTKEVLEDSACFTCLSRKQMLQGLVTKFGNDLLGERHSAQDVVDAFHCLVCVPDQQLLAAILHLLCSDLTISAGEFQ